MREKIKAILERLEYSGTRAIDYQRCEVAEVQIQSALTKLEALFTASQFELKTESDARLELIKRMLEKMEQKQAETAAMRDIIDRLPNVSCCAWETLEENMGYGEGELQAKIDTALKGGK